MNSKWTRNWKNIEDRSVAVAVAAAAMNCNVKWNGFFFFQTKNTNFMEECKLNSFVIISIVTQSLTLMHKQTDIVVAVVVEILISCSIPVHHKFQISMLNFRLMRIQCWMCERKSIINAIASFSPTKRIRWAGEQSDCAQ